MVTSKQALDKYGDPSLEKGMVLFLVPIDLQIGVVPKKIYCNKDMVEPLKKALYALKCTGYISELKTWDGCFNIRKKIALSSMSLHSWGLAIDVNQAENGLNMTPKLSKGFVECFTSNGFDWGGNWERMDGMHFQLSKI